MNGKDEGPRPSEGGEACLGRQAGEREALHLGASQEGPGLTRRNTNEEDPGFIVRSLQALQGALIAGAV